MNIGLMHAGRSFAERNLFVFCREAATSRFPASSGGANAA
jgi:hypothetical protein